MHHENNNNNKNTPSTISGEDNYLQLERGIMRNAFERIKKCIQEKQPKEANDAFLIACDLALQAKEDYSKEIESAEEECLNLDIAIFGDTRN